MEILLDHKFIFIVIAIILMLISYYPYIRDIFALKTKPHIYTWIIWFMTQGTASLAAIYGESLYTGIGLFAGTFMVLIITILSIKYGTKDITKVDTISLLFAFMAIFVWWQLNNPLLAVIMVSLIDGVGYFPSFRKSWRDPSSETHTFWLLMFFSTLFTFLANDEYNLLTSLYLIIMLICNLIMFLIAYIRPRFLNRDK